MSLEERIKGISVACNPSGESMRHKAATLAAEADELMREMAEALMWVRDCNTSDKEEVLNLHKTVLESIDDYNNWKEQNQ